MGAGFHIDEVRAIEQAAVYAWPATETRCIDGWLWRCSGGHSQRANSVSPLRFAVRDASELARVLQTRGGFSVTLITDDTTTKPNKANIIEQVRAVLSKCQKGDMALLAFAGHGAQFDGTPRRHQLCLERRCGQCVGAGHKHVRERGPRREGLAAE